jgi:hypothetical protein
VLDKYFIVLVNGKITISGCKDGEFSPLKREGEEEQNYNEKEFWGWFKEKIEYDNEKLSFVVVSDREDFSIDKEIKISEKNSFENDNLCKKKIEKLNSKYPLFFFPFIQIEVTIPKKNKIEIPKKTISEKKVKNITKKTIADIFNRQTQEYENDKR